MARAIEALEAETWWCTTPEAIRMIGGVRAPDARAVVGGEVLADASLAAALTHLPERGRVAVDRITVADRALLHEVRPHLELVDAGPLLLAGSVPRSVIESAVLHDGYRRTERAVEAACAQITVGMRERDCANALAREGIALGLEPHIDHVWTVLPRSRRDAPWLRGSWEGHAPWRQLTSDRVLAEGDLLALDAGFFFDGYVTDFGATFVVGREAASEERALAARWTEIADRVTRAIVPGATAADLRAAALGAHDDPEPPWPFGLYVAHGVGFGGVVPPFAGTDLGVRAEQHMALEPGDVLMIEPYVFVDGVGGFRAERCVTVTESGATVWTTLGIERLEPIGIA